MKTLEILTIFSLFAFTFASVDWETFKNHHGKRYGNPREEAFRKQIFQSNLQRIEQHNERFRSGQESFSMGINQFGDMNEDEYRKYILCLTQHNVSQSEAAVRSLELKDLPESVNWTEKGAVTRVKNQGDCGSCWAFSSTGSLESQLFLKTGKLVELSEQNLVDCSASFGNMGCSGGLMENAFQYVRYNKGIDSEEGYPYEAKENTCRFKKEAVATTDSGFIKINAGDEKALQKAVAEIGPVSVAIDASGRFQFYEKGIYYNKECAAGGLNHGVLAVGYGVEDGQDYWLVKNSWGTSWGEQGYIKMARNKDNNCGIASLALYPTLQ